MLTAWISWLVIGFFFLGGQVFSQDLPEQKDALRGLDSLRVEMTLVGNASSIDITEAHIRPFIESRLREAGFQVRSVDDRSARGDPRLLVTIHTISVTGGCTFMVSVQLVERFVPLRRYVELMLSDNLPITPTSSVEALQLTDGVGWQARAMGTTRANRAQEFVTESVLAYVDRFVSDFKSSVSF
jgi:hypothetical protein